jgi:hypothetical protein
LLYYSIWSNSVQIENYAIAKFEHGQTTRWAGYSVVLRRPTPTGCKFMVSLQQIALTLKCCRKLLVPLKHQSYFTCFLAHLV